MVSTLWLHCWCHWHDIFAGVDIMVLFSALALSPASRRQCWCQHHGIGTGVSITESLLVLPPASASTLMLASLSVSASLTESALMLCITACIGVMASVPLPAMASQHHFMQWYNVGTASIDIKTSLLALALQFCWQNWLTSVTADTDVKAFKASVQSSQHWCHCKYWHQAPLPAQESWHRHHSKHT